LAQRTLLGGVKKDKPFRRLTFKQDCQLVSKVSSSQQICSRSAEVIFFKPAKSAFSRVQVAGSSAFKTAVKIDS